MCEAMSRGGVIEVHKEFPDKSGEENFRVSTAVVSEESSWEVYRMGGVCSGDMEVCPERG